ncbi:unnamed protein product [Haemonchus placei]|uniref:Cyanophycinase n=1 Tax=Haemonchus placei TaxID=6290 RepID=A0A0N4X0U3_HAEPC|nr:unnamed protein product [Haemonchus placei]
MIGLMMIGVSGSDSSVKVSSGRARVTVVGSRTNGGAYIIAFGDNHEIDIPQALKEKNVLPIN